MRLVDGSILINRPDAPDNKRVYPDKWLAADLMEKQHITFTLMIPLLMKMCKVFAKHGVLPANVRESLTAI